MKIMCGKRKSDKTNRDKSCNETNLLNKICVLTSLFAYFIQLSVCGFILLYINQCVT